MSLHKETGIKFWPIDERPRERLFKEGEHRLTNAELLAILIGSGVKGQSAIALSQKILARFKTFRQISHIDLNDWKEFKGLGMAKIARIKTAVEIGRRFREEGIKDARLKIGSSKDIAEIFLPRMRDLKKEVFKAVFLDSTLKIIDIKEITEGTVDRANPIIREIFHKAMQYFAVSIICVHNHPSGDSKPSPEDKKFTQELVQAGKVLQIKVLDHIIIGDNKYYSFSDERLI